MAAPLLQVVDRFDPYDATGAGPYALAVVRTLGGAVLSFSTGAGSDAGDAWPGIPAITPRPNESLRAVWRRALDEVRPGAVFVQHLGLADPALLLDLRERGIPYAVFLPDFTPLCPTHQLWHRRDEPCSGPGRTGWKCAWCVSGTRRRALELPLRTVLYRHRPRNWRTALIRADALIAPSRFARDFWVGQGAPPERIAVIPPHLPEATAAAGPASAQARIFYAGGWGPGSGGEPLAAALDHLRRPVCIEAVGAFDDAAQAQFRAAMAPRHSLAFHGALSTQAMATLLAACPVAAFPTRWEQPSNPLVAVAQLVGARVVATAAGGLTEEIIHGVNGYLAARDDPAAFAEALQEAIEAALRPTPDTGAWAGDRIMRNVEAASRAAQERLRSLERLLSQDTFGAATENVALALEHAAWLDHAAVSGGLSPSEGSRSLIAALRHDPEAEPAPSGDGFAARARAASWRRRVDLNHAIAFFRGSGCRRIVHLAAPTSPAVSDAADWFAAWGLEAVPPETLPDGLFEDAGAAPATDPALLRLRFPQAHALVVIASDGIATQGWGPKAD